MTEKTQDPEELETIRQRFTINYDRCFEEAFKGREKELKEFRDAWYPPREIFEYVTKQIQGADPFIRGVGIVGSLPMINFKYKDEPGVIIFQWQPIPVAVYVELKKIGGKLLAERMNPKFTMFMPAWNAKGRAYARKKYLDSDFNNAARARVSEFYAAYTAAVPVTTTMVKKAFLMQDPDQPKQIDLSAVSDPDSLRGRDGIIDLGKLADNGSADELKENGIIDLSKLGGDSGKK